MIGPPLARQFDIGRWRQLAGLSPFLQRRFGVTRVGFDVLDPVAPPEGQDYLLCGFETGVKIDRGNHRLHRVAQKRQLAATAGLHLGAAQFQHCADIDLARHICTGFLAHQRVIARSQSALGRVRIIP